jgi:hypothetical protein
MPMFTSSARVEKIRNISLLLFGSESFVFQIAIKKFKNQDIQNYNFALLFCMGVKLGR